jgi:membrane-associated phospholipid phosphatase
MLAQIVRTNTTELLGELDNLDRSVYAAIARSHTPELDRFMARLSNAANYSRLSLASAAALAVARGDQGREAAKLGLASVAATAAVVNIVIKPLGRRQRPDPTAHRVPSVRRVRVPKSRSWPSGHTAAAFAFASGVSDVLPWEGGVLHLLAAVVGYSRVHTGVHYPSDVIVGALTGTIVSRIVVNKLTRGAEGDPGERPEAYEAVLG